MGIGPVQPRSGAPITVERASQRIGCVSFLNAKPLIDGLEDVSQVPGQVRYDVPSQLLGNLEAHEVDIALCPVIDYQRSCTPLAIVPVGGIGCYGRTLTVRLYSQVPLPQIRRIYADIDSHTSVVLLQVILDQQYGVQPDIVDYNAREQVAENRLKPWPGAMLLIGDKIVTGSPPAVRYPHQLDLGQAWLELTRLPFVFAVWMTRTDAVLEDLPAVLTRVKEVNSTKTAQIVQRYATAQGWPPDLATQYLNRWICYDVGPSQLRAMEHFFDLAHRLNLIKDLRPIRIWSHQSESTKA